MTATQWALIYLAVGAALIALTWHNGEQLMMRELAMTHTVLAKRLGDRPAILLAALAMLVALLFSVVLWPIEIMVAGVLLLKRR